MTGMETYHASPIKRKRATAAEMEERASFLIGYADEHAPVTVRQLFYAATVAGLIDKTESGYGKVQSQVLKLRQEGRLPYYCIADATRYMRKIQSFDGWEDALRDTAAIYRKDLWADANVRVEVWLEKSALAGVVSPVIEEYDVALMPTVGYTSETFAYSAVDALRGSGKALVIYALYDFDRSGQDASASLREKVCRFGRKYGVDVEFHHLGLSKSQVIEMDLPTRPAKRKGKADQRWPYDFAAELDAVPPDDLRSLVRDAIEQHLPAWRLRILKEVEKAERATLENFIGETCA